MRACSRPVLCGTAAFSARLVSVRYSSSASEKNLKIYHSRFPSILPLIKDEVTLYDFAMKRMKAADPRKVASVQADTEQLFTYGDIIGLTEQFAQVLYHVGGVRKGDVVSICLLNNSLYGPMVYGILRLGGIVSTINAVGAPSTLAYHFKTNKCKVVLAMKFFQTNVETAANIAEREMGKTIKILYLEDLLKNIPDHMSIPADYQPLKDAKPDDTVFIPFSSGTTGMPKGVQLTNRNLIANTEQGKAAQGVTCDLISVTVLPFFHIFGFMCCLNAILTSTATQIVMSKYNVNEYVRLTAKYKANYNAVAPPIVISLLNHADLLKRHDLSSLKLIRCAAAPLGPEVEQMCKKMLPWVSIAQGYGMTEMGPGMTVTPSPDMEGCVEPPSGAAGVILPDTEIRIVKVDDSQQSGADKSAGVDCKPGEDGEVWTRGPQMFKGYLNAEDTEKTMQDGWYRTGDIGQYDSQTGYLTITDRLKELIKYKGFQVSPASMESVILQHPWVADCVVVGVPDPHDASFEIPRALVVLKTDISTQNAVHASDSIYRFIMVHSPPHKRLHGGVRIVDVIPRNASNKTMRRQIRADEVAYMKAGRVDPSTANSATAAA